MIVSPSQIEQFKYTPQTTAKQVWTCNLSLHSRDGPVLPEVFEEVDMYEFNTVEESIREEEEEKAKEQEERGGQDGDCATQWFH